MTAKLQTVPAADLNPLVILNKMVETGADPDKLSRMMDLVERWQAKQAEAAFAAAMAACQAEMPAVLRDAANSHTQSRYARLETITAAIKPTYTKHGFSLSFDTEDSKLENHIRIRCDVMHAAGHVKPYHADIPVDGAGFKGAANKTGTQATGSTYSYGRRYLTLFAFNVVIANEDNDGVWGLQEFISPAQVEVIDQLIDACKIAGRPVDVARFLKYIGGNNGTIEDVEKIPASKFTLAKNELERRVGKDGDR